MPKNSAVTPGAVVLFCFVRSKEGKYDLSDRIDLRKPRSLKAAVLLMSLSLLWLSRTLFSTPLSLALFLLASFVILKIGSFLHEELHYATLVRKGYRAHKVIRNFLPNGYTYCDDPIRMPDFREALLAPFCGTLALGGVLVMASMVIAPRYPGAPAMVAFWGLWLVSGCANDVYWYIAARTVPDTYWAVILEEKDALFSSESAAREFIEAQAQRAPLRK